jgi:hypothetical protein
MLGRAAVAACSLAAFALLAPAGPASAGTVRVESKDMQRTYKRASTRGGVRLVKQLSREACVEGVSWGFDRERIWVDQGCRAEFEIGGATPASGGSLFGGPKTVKVESGVPDHLGARFSQPFSVTATVSSCRMPSSPGM